MPTMIRPDNEAKKIMESIIGKPTNHSGKVEKAPKPSPYKKPPLPTEYPRDT